MRRRFRTASGAYERAGLDDVSSGERKRADRIHHREHLPPKRDSVHRHAGKNLPGLRHHAVAVLRGRRVGRAFARAARRVRKLAHINARAKGRDAQDDAGLQPRSIKRVHS